MAKSVPGWFFFVIPWFHRLLFPRWVQPEPAHRRPSPPNASKISARTQKTFLNTSAEEARPGPLGSRRTLAVAVSVPTLGVFDRIFSSTLRGPGDHHLHWREEWGFKLVSWQPVEPLTTFYLTSLWISPKTHRFHWGFESITMVVGLLLAFITWVLLVFYEWALCALLVFPAASPQAITSADATNARHTPRRGRARGSPRLASCICNR